MGSQSSTTLAGITINFLRNVIFNIYQTYDEALSIVRDFSLGNSLISIAWLPEKKKKKSNFWIEFSMLDEHSDWGENTVLSLLAVLTWLGNRLDANKQPQKSPHHNNNYCDIDFL